ncbi:MAG: radical SAM protein [Coprothermobacterota bacterium]|nr:radical SAM protein [Coprothermobacterota bacterium]
MDYTINPYVGCTHACLYCYADFMQRFTGHSEPWGSFLDAKTNAPAILARQLRRVKEGRVILSSVTDPYQLAESSFGLTRACLLLLRESPLAVSILTKSPLVVRDLDLLRTMPHLEVGISLSTLDPALARLFDGAAPSPKERLRALAALSAAGIRTWLFLSPCLPGISDGEDALGEVLRRAQEAGASEVLVDTLQLYPRPWGRLKPVLGRRHPHLLPLWEEYRNHKPAFAQALRHRLTDLAGRFSLTVRCVF